MSNKFVEPILHEPFCKLGFSGEFLVVAELAGFFSLADLLEKRTWDLLRLPGFDYHLLGELVSFLESRHLGHYIDPA